MSHVSTLLSSLIGHMLRRHREKTRLTQARVAEEVGVSMRTIVRIENGEARPRVGDLRVLLELYGVDDKREREVFEVMLREAGKPGWWSAYEDSLGITYRLQIALEEWTDALTLVSTHVIHGLMQTRGYAEAVQRPYDSVVDEVDVYVQMRMERQQRLFARDPMPSIEFLVDEAALCHPIGGPQVMAEQVTHLADLAERGTISLRVVPLDAKLYASPEPFVIYHGPGTQEFVASGGSLTSVFVEDESQLKIFRDAHRTGKSLALSESASIELTRKYAATQYKR